MSKKNILAAFMALTVLTATSGCAANLEENPQSIAQDESESGVLVLGVLGVLFLGSVAVLSCNFAPSCVASAAEATSNIIDIETRKFKVGVAETQENVSELIAIISESSNPADVWVLLNAAEKEEAAEAWDETADAAEKGAEAAAEALGKLEEEIAELEESLEGELADAEAAVRGAVEERIKIAKGWAATQEEVLQRQRTLTEKARATAAHIRESANWRWDAASKGAGWLLNGTRTQIRRRVKNMFPQP